MPATADNTSPPGTLPSCAKKVTHHSTGPDQFRRWCFAWQVPTGETWLDRHGAFPTIGITLITHTMADILRARVLAIACGYPDADSLDDLRKDPAFQLACEAATKAATALASQPTMSRWRTRQTCAPCSG